MHGVFHVKVLRQKSPYACLLQTNRTLIPHVPEINVKITDVHPF